MEKSFFKTDGLRVLIMVLILSAIPVVSGVVPSITVFNNSINNDSIYPHINVNQVIQFNASANQAITAWNWRVDGSLITNNFDNYSTSWIDGGAHTVNVSAINTNGTSNSNIWYVMVKRQKSTASDTHASVNTSWFTSLKDSMGGSGSFTRFFVALSLPFTYWMGNLFYLFVFGLPLAIIWIRQEKALIPATLGIIFGAVIFGFIPEAWVLPAELMILLTIFGILYALFKERG